VCPLGVAPGLLHSCIFVGLDLDNRVKYVRWFAGSLVRWFAGCGDERTLKFSLI
jgi:hypothetical protein